MKINPQETKGKESLNTLLNLTSIKDSVTQGNKGKGVKHSLIISLEEKGVFD